MTRLGRDGAEALRPEDVRLDTATTRLLTHYSRGDKMEFYMTVQNDAIEVSDIFGEDDRVLYRITTTEQYNDFIKFRRPDSIMCSSSLDFPEDYTKDRGVIALCRALRDRSD